MGSISIAQELEDKLQALGIPTPTSLDVEYYFHNPVGPGQPEQTRLPFLPVRKNGMWKAGQLNHSWVGCLNVDSLDSQNMDLDDVVWVMILLTLWLLFMILSPQRHRAVDCSPVCNTLVKTFSPSWSSDSHTCMVVLLTLLLALSLSFIYFNSCNYLSSFTSLTRDLAVARGHCCPCNGIKDPSRQRSSLQRWLT